MPKFGERGIWRSQKNAQTHGRIVAEVNNGRLRRELSASETIQQIQDVQAHKHDA
jgi:hypothetical protein